MGSFRQIVNVAVLNIFFVSCSGAVNESARSLNTLGVNANQSTSDSQNIESVTDPEVADQEVTDQALRLPGDANLDGTVNQDDVTMICNSGKYNTGEPATWAEGDFTGDGKVDFDDILAFFPNYSSAESLSHLEGCAFLAPNSDSQSTESVTDPEVTDQALRLPGDANLDGTVNQDDVTMICNSGKYNTGEPATWAEGDFTGDGKVDFDDILAFFPNYSSAESLSNERCTFLAPDGSQ